MGRVARFARSEFHFFSGLNRLIRAFYESIANKTAPPIPYDDILRLSGWLDEIWRQVPQGKSAAPQIAATPSAATPSAGGGESK